MTEPDWAVLDRVPSEGLHLLPLGIVRCRHAAAALAAGEARALAGGPVAFTAVAAIGLDRDRRPVSVVAPVRGLEAALAHTRFAPSALRRLGALSAGCAPWAGFALDRPLVMGIVNVTPDSFSDGGRWLDPERAIEHALALREAGAEILDVGGESTRPGAAPLPEIGRAHV